MRALRSFYVHIVKTQLKSNKRFPGISCLQCDWFSLLTVDGSIKTIHHSNIKTEFELTEICAQILLLFRLLRHNRPGEQYDRGDMCLVRWDTFANSDASQFVWYSREVGLTDEDAPTAPSVNDRTANGAGNYAFQASGGCLLTRIWFRCVNCE